MRKARLARQAILVRSGRPDHLDRKAIRGRLVRRAARARSGRRATLDQLVLRGRLVRKGTFVTVAFVGRDKDVIKRGGYSVFAVEVQGALEEHPEVLEAAVIGLPDDTLGEVPVAAVRLVEGSSLDAAELAAWARRHLAEYKVPDRFVVVALVKVYTDNPPNSMHVSLSWFNPFAVSSLSALIAGVLLAVFIYWGWDSTVTVNEETKDATRTPGLGALTATVVLVAIYLIVSVAAQAYGGVDQLVKNSDDVLSALANEVLGTTLGKIVIIAVLTSASDGLGRRVSASFSPCSSAATMFWVLSFCCFSSAAASLIFLASSFICSASKMARM